MLFSNGSPPPTNLHRHLSTNPPPIPCLSGADTLCLPAQTHTYKPPLILLFGLCWNAAGCKSRAGSPFDETLFLYLLSITPRHTTPPSVSSRRAALALLCLCRQNTHTPPAAGPTSPPPLTHTKAPPRPANHQNSARNSRACQIAGPVSHALLVFCVLDFPLHHHTAFRT